MQRFKRASLCYFVFLLCFLAVFLNILIPSISSDDAGTAKPSTDRMEGIPATYQEKGITIMLDAGHGGYDSGSIAADGTLEKDITLSLVMKIGAYLEAAGYTLAYTREQDEVPWENDNLTDLQTRIAMAQDVQADYYISIHTNASTYDDGAAGYGTYVDGQNEDILHIAESIHSALGELSYSYDRGIKSTNDHPLYVIDQNLVPALLLEVGFMSDEEDKQYMTTHQDALAKAIAQGILHAL